MKTTIQAATGVVIGFGVCWTITAIGDWWYERSRVRTMHFIYDWFKESTQEREGG